MRKILLSLSLTFTSLLLTGCISAAWTSAQLAYDHYNIKKQANDYRILNTANNAINNDPQLGDHTNITVSTLNHVVLLTGQVPNKQLKHKAAGLVRRVPQVRYVVNDLSVKPFTSASQHIKDSWLTAQVKTHLFSNGSVDASSIKVISEDNVVYLLGVVRPQQGKLATTIASKTPGVKKVVKLFEYIRIQRLPTMAYHTKRQHHA